MAKKTKKQKSGMLKRKQQKKVKKAIQRKRSATHSPQEPRNEKELHKLLSRIPILAYEPELNEMRFDQDALKDLIASDKNDPQILVELISPEIIQKFETSLKEMEERVEGQMQKSMMVKGIVYVLENQEMPHFANSLIVAIYLKSKAEAQGESLEVSQILKAVSEYEKMNIETIEQMIEEGTKAAEALVVNEEVEDFAPVKETQIDQALLDEYYETLASLDDTEQERLQDDLEVFLDDYVTVPMTEWNADLLDDFLGTWFIQNLNPMIEDLESIQKSLERFFQFLADQEKIDKDISQKIIKVLQDKETYKQRMSA